MSKRKWTLKEAFAYFGAKATNQVWGWSARSEDGATVVLTLWDDLDQHLLDDGKKITVDNFGHRDLARWTNALGNRDRIKNLIHAREHCDDLFRVVWVTAKDPTVIPRSIRRLYPDATLVMRLTRLCETTGEFSAESVKR